MRLPKLASGFVIAVWATMLLDWLHRRFGPKPEVPQPDGAQPVGPNQTCPSHRPGVDVFREPKAVTQNRHPASRFAVCARRIVAAFWPVKAPRMAANGSSGAIT